MKIETFKEIIKMFKMSESRLETTRNAGVSLIEYIEPYDTIIHNLLREIYNEEGLESFYWFVYDNKFGKGDLSFKVNGEEIGNSVKKFHKYLEKCLK